MKRVENLTIDVKNSEYTEIKLKQMDSTRLVIKLLDDSEQINLTGHTADIVFTKPNGQIIIQDAVIDINKNIVVDLDDACVRGYGTAKLEVELKKNSEVLSSFQVNVKIEKTNKENIKEDNTVNYIESMQKNIDNMKEESDEILTQHKNLIKEAETLINNGTDNTHVYIIRRLLNSTDSAWERQGDSVGLVANATKNGEPVRNDFDNLYPWNSIICYNWDNEKKKITAYYGEPGFAFDGSNGDVFTKIPEFWWNRWRDDLYEYIAIADYAKAGYHYFKGGSPARYFMSIDENGVAHSVSGTIPAYMKNIKTYRTAATSLGEEFCLMDITTYSAMLILYLVEYADYNSEKKLGKGNIVFARAKAIVAEQNTNRIIVANTGNLRVGRTVCIGKTDAWDSSVAHERTITKIEDYAENGITGKEITFDGDPVDIAIDNAIWGMVQRQGETDVLGMKSGCLVDDSKHESVYRGVVWQGLWAALDGANVKNYILYINRNPKTYESDVFDGDYKELGYVCLQDNNVFAKTLGYDSEMPDIMIPIEKGGSSSTGICDGYWSNSGNRVVYAGGDFDDGETAGLFAFNLDHSSSDGWWNYGARLLKYQ